MKLRLCISLIALLACLWSVFVMLNGKVIFDEAFIIAKSDALSLMLAQVLVVPCVLWLALNKRRV
jgi:hypothetical protein